MFLMVFVWSFFGVYGPIIDGERCDLQEDLLTAGGFFPWCTAGDYNTDCFPSKCAGADSACTSMWDFSNVKAFNKKGFHLFTLMTRYPNIIDITEHGLINLPLEGGAFTQSNNYESPSMFLISLEQDEYFCNSNQRLLPQTLSDHFQILVDANGINSGKGLFKFDNIWLKIKGFMVKERQWQSSYHFSGTPSVNTNC